MMTTQKLRWKQRTALFSQLPNNIKNVANIAIEIAKKIKIKSFKEDGKKNYKNVLFGKNMD